MTRKELYAIERADALRRAARESAELALLTGKPVSTAPDGIDPYHWSRSISGQPKDKHRNVRVAPSSWTRGLSMHGRTVGVAPGSPETATGASVRVTDAEGRSTIRPASAFRSQRLAAKQYKHVTEVRANANQEYLDTKSQYGHRVTAADLT